MKTDPVKDAQDKINASRGGGGAPAAGTGFTPPAQVTTVGQYGPTGVADASDPNTWMVTLNRQASGVLAKFPGKATDEGLGGVTTTTLQQGIGYWFKMTPAERKQWAQQAFSYGYIDNPNDMLGAQDQWSKMVALAANSSHYNPGTHFTPWEMMEQMQGSVSDKLAQRGPVTTNTATYTDFSKTNVLAMANTVLRQRLGREATPSEVATFFNAVQADEKKDPSRSTSTQMTGPGGTTQTVTNTQHQGYSSDDVNAMLENAAKQNPEYAGYQGATTYFGAAMQALGAIGGQ